MKRNIVALLFLVLAGNVQGIDLKGKWGLGAGTGGLIGSGVETSLIRVKTERTAWVLDMNVLQRYEERSLEMSQHARDYSLCVGPRIRRFSRLGAVLTPYGDVYLHLIGSGISYVLESKHSSMYIGPAYSVGGEFGLGGGVEYFTSSHFSIAAHTTLLNVKMARLWGKEGERYHGWGVWSNLGFYPKVQLRVYF